jgi:hypothetical protein
LESRKWEEHKVLSGMTSVEDAEHSDNPSMSKAHENVDQVKQSVLKTEELLSLNLLTS